MNSVQDKAGRERDQHAFAMQTDMPADIPAMRIPSIEQCLVYTEKYGMYENIRQHSLMVARVAEAIHCGLVAAGRTNGAVPDRDMIVAGALLHDIAKTRCLQEDCKHALVGEEICRELGYPEIAEIVRDHVVLSSFNSALYTQGIFAATEIVYYADKRVKHDRIVPLESRLAYILDKYSNNESIRETIIRQNFKQCQDLEAYLFSCLDFSPAELPARITYDLLPAR
jgi:uncharacterized protein